VACYHHITSGCIYLWNYFGSSHGKNPHDEARAMLKWFIKQTQLDTQVYELQNAIHVVVLLRTKLNMRPKSAYSSVQKLITWVFFHVKRDDIDMVNEYTCEAIKSTRDLYSIRSLDVMDVNKFMEKTLSCFCCFCVDGNFDACENLP
jgi:hypothetical protein